MSTAIATGRRTLRLEGEAILAAESRLDDRFGTAIDLLAAGGRVLVTGIGKSGVIAQKIAATLTSTGTPATYVHPIESLHGDLGLVERDTVAIVLSKSGETDELFGLLAALARLDIPIVAITGDAGSSLARASRVVLDASVAEEACPHDLAPTTSTAVALALGDALAVALLERKGFKRTDFAALHPGGRLGRKLLVRVEDVMDRDVTPLEPATTMKHVVITLAHGRGIAVIADADRLAGVVTAGDLTRLAERSADYHDVAAREVMTTTPHVARAEDLAASVVGQMERHAIMAMPVLDANDRIVGVVHLHDLLRAGAA